jgi:hypothetical protein
VAVLQAELYGGEPEVDYIVDAVADAYQEWRNSWAATLGEASEDPKVQSYLRLREKFFQTLEWYYERSVSKDSPYLAAGEHAVHPLTWCRAHGTLNVFGAECIAP